MQSPFTDNDIQDYLEGVFTGDVQALEAWLQGSAEGKKRLDFYQSLFKSLQQSPLPSLKVSIEDSVINALGAREQKRSFDWNILLWTVIILCIAGAFISSLLLLEDLSFFKQLAGNLLLPVVIGVVVLLPLLLHGLDWHRQNERYKKWLS